MPDQRLPFGKIRSEMLERLLAVYTGRGDRVIIGAGIGEDATVIDMGPRYLIAKTDPITHVTGEVGHYVVNINANDIAAMGGRPMWFLATILVPEGTRAEALEHIFAQIAESCGELGVVYCGGHTEVSSAVSRPVVVGQMLGEAEKPRLKPSSGARAGDELLMTKSAAIEATSIIAREKAEDLASRFSETLIRRARNYLHDPGISIVREAQVAAGLEAVHALHDPTEGGIATGIFEMATASNLGVEVFAERIAVTEETRQLCGFYQVDPLGTFASGALLMAVEPAGAGILMGELRSRGIGCARIGRMVGKEQGMCIRAGDGVGPLPVFHQDELSRIFG